MSPEEPRNQEKARCSQCGATSQQRPLIQYEFKGQEKRICLQCLPMLIHGAAPA